MSSSPRAVLREAQKLYTEAVLLAQQVHAADMAVEEEAARRIEEAGLTDEADVYEALATGMISYDLSPSINAAREADIAVAQAQRALESLTFRVQYDWDFLERRPRWPYKMLRQIARARDDVAAALDVAATLLRQMRAGER